MRFNADAFRLIVTHGTAALVILGTVLGLFWLMATGQLEVNVGIPAIVGIAGGAVAFLFVTESAKQAEKASARAAETATAAAAASTAAATSTGNGKPPAAGGKP